MTVDRLTDISYRTTEMNAGFIIKQRVRMEANKYVRYRGVHETHDAPSPADTDWFDEIECQYTTFRV